MNTIFSRWVAGNVFKGFSSGALRQSFQTHASASHQNFFRFFTSDVEKSPPTSLLKKKIWAVHASSMPPINGELTPFFNRNAWGLSDPSIPNFANTIHWSLGELARPFWEHRTFAVVTPFDTIINQALNIFIPHTITWGKWNLASSSIVVAPHIVDTSDLKRKGIKVITYDKVNNNLRSIVKRIIRDEGGWTFRTPNQGSFLGAKAQMNGQKNVNTLLFFDNLFKEYPGKFSFGDEFHSQIGDVYLLGFIKELYCTLGISKTNSEKYVYLSLLQHYYNKAKNKYFSAAEQEKMELFLVEKKKEISDPSTLTAPLNSNLSADFFHPMTQKELHAFLENHAQLLILFQNNLHEFEGTWAACRWLVIGYEQGLREGLNNIIDKEFKLFLASQPEFFAPTFVSMLEKHKSSASDQFHVFNAILKLEGVHEYLHLFEEGKKI